MFHHTKLHLYIVMKVIIDYERSEMQPYVLKPIYNKSLHAQYNSHNTKVSQMLDKPTTKGCESSAGKLDDQILCKFGDAMLYQSINILYFYSSMIFTPKMTNKR